MLVFDHRLFKLVYLYVVVGSGKVYLRVRRQTLGSIDKDILHLASEKLG